MTSFGERAAYWRVPWLPLEAMEARFERYAYPTHAHDTYSFGVTDHGAQSFVCRGGRHVSAAGLVMAFNPDDPHDGQSAVRDGYRYRMLHLGEEHVREVLADAAPGSAGLPLFDTPVVDNPALAGAIARLHAAVAENAPRLVVEERLTSAVLSLSRHAATRPRRHRTGRAALTPPAWTGPAICCGSGSPTTSPPTTWRERPVAAASRCTGASVRRTASPPATTSAICGCAEPAHSLPRG